MDKLYEKHNNETSGLLQNSNISKEIKDYNEMELFKFKDKYFVFFKYDISCFEVSKPIFDFFFSLKENKDESIINYNDKNLNRAIDFLKIKSDLTKNTMKQQPASELLKTKIYKTYSISTIKECNIRCKYCFRDDDTGRKIEILSREKLDEIFEYIINDSKDVHKIFVLFNMLGESLLDFDGYKYIFNKAKKYEIREKKEILVSMLTNGVLLTNEIIDWMNENGGMFGVSVDGDKEYHDQLRVKKDGSGTYDIIKEKIDYMFSKNWKIFAPGSTVTITKLNLDLIRIIKHLYNLGFRTINIKPIRSNKKDELAISGEYSELLEENYIKLVDFFIEEAKNKNIEYLKTIVSEIDYFGRFFVRLLRQDKIYKRCETGDGFKTITPDGNIYPCDSLSYVEEFKLGNIKTGILQNRIFSPENVEEKDECNKCWAQYICGGNCAHSSYRNYSDYKKVDIESCEFIQFLIKLAAYLISSLNDVYPESIEELNSFIKERYSTNIRPDIQQLYTK